MPKKAKETVAAPSKAYDDASKSIKEKTIGELIDSAIDAGSKALSSYRADSVKGDSIKCPDKKEQMLLNGSKNPKITKNQKETKTSLIDTDDIVEVVVGTIDDVLDFF